MTAFLYRAAMVALTASALTACAMDAPSYPVREAVATPRADVAPRSDAPAPRQRESAPVLAAYAPAPEPRIVAVNTMATGQGAPVGGAVIPVSIQAEPPVAASSEAPAPPPVDERYRQAPVTEEPAASGVAPPVNRRPGHKTESEAAVPVNRRPAADREPAPVARASRSRAAPPAPTGRPLVAGRVVSVNDVSHTVEVEKGDTVNTISDGLMTPKEALIKANRLRNPRELEVGRSLKIPVHKAYVVQSGDTLYGIARRFSTPVDVLSDLNRMDAKSRLRPGQKVALPELAKDTGPEMARGEARSESAAEIARADEHPRSRRVRAEEAADETPPPASTSVPSSTQAGSTQAGAFAEPSSPRPYASLGGRTPSRGSSYSSGAVPPSRPAYPPATGSVEAAPPVSDNQIQLAGRGRFVWPVRGQVLSGFGPKPGGQRNDGLDIAAPEHASVRASASGDVVYAGDQIPGFGNLVLIKHEGGWVTAYAHLSMSEVKIKEHVSQGDEIGQVGQTGGVDKPQLHFEIRYAPSPRDKARPIDPSLVLAGQAD
jgi:murein DD-endopeptidase MepM/ murein hydrolase activator NlpD